MHTTEALPQGYVLCHSPIHFSLSFILLANLALTDSQSACLPACRQCAAPTDKTVRRRILNELFQKCLPSKSASQSGTADG